MRRIFIATPVVVIAGAALTIAALIAAVPQQPGRLGEAPDAARKGANPPSGPGGPGFGPGTFLAPQALAAADTDKDGQLTPIEAASAARRFVQDADVDKKGSVDAQTLGQAINRKIGPPPGFGGDGPPGGPNGPPDGFGPGTFIAPRIVELADANADKRLSPEEAAKYAETFIKGADSKKTGSIDADTLAESMNRQMGPPPGFGPGGPMGGEERKLVKTFDKDRDGRLNLQERLAARESIKKEREKTPQGGRRGFGPPPGFGGEDEPAKPGPHVEASSVEAFASKGIYDPGVVRTLFLQFEDKDWESALTDFHATDVEVPADLTVDGRKYPGVGVHFRGMSSYMMVKAGHKRSLNLSLDFVDPNQRLGGYKTLNLLNSHEDPSFLHTILYSQIARSYIPAPKANFVRLVVNGESWGVYVNAQQFDKTFLVENYKSSEGARWKVRGNPGADGGLRYAGDEIEEYKKRFEMKSGGKQDWDALIVLCKTLNQTPPNQLEAALKPILDIDGVLWFLALDNALINGDGYWTRASDYSLFRDKAGKFHVIPHDMNEAFGPAMMFGFGGPGGRQGGPGGPGGPGRGPGGPGGPGRGPGGPGGGPGGRPPAKVDLDPLVGLDNTRTPLRSKLFAVPVLKTRYLEHVRTIAEEWLDWQKLGPVVAGYRSLIEEGLAADTRKLTSLEAFHAAVADSVKPEATPKGRPSMSLRTFADQRRAFLLEYLSKNGGTH